MPRKKYRSEAESGLMTQSVLMMTGDGSTQMSDQSIDNTHYSLLYYDYCYNYNLLYNN